MIDFFCKIMAASNFYDDRKSALKVRPVCDVTKDKFKTLITRKSLALLQQYLAWDLLTASTSGKNFIFGDQKYFKPGAGNSS